MAYDIKQIATKALVEVYDKKNLDYIDEVCAEDYRGHDPMAGTYDREGLKAAAKGYFEAFPDMSFKILEAYAEGNTCVCRWEIHATHQGSFQGLDPSGNEVRGEGVTIFKFKDGKIVEDLEFWDTYSALKQMGIVPDVETLTARTSSEAGRPEAGA
jgi:steroid delta-isomerase-like uncharacterized protein